VIVLAVLVAVTASFQVVLANRGALSSRACHARSRATLGGSTMVITTSSGASSMVSSRLSDPNSANRR